MAKESSALMFLEYPDEADAYLSHPISKDGQFSSSVVVALRPATRAYLMRRGHGAENTLPYLTPTSRTRALNKSAELTRWIRTRFDFEDNWGVRADYAENLVWYIRSLINYLLCSLEILDNGVANHRAGTVGVCISKSKDPSGPMLNKGERYFGTVAERFAAARGLELQPIRVRMRPSPRDHARSVLRYLVTVLAPNPLVARLHRYRLRRLGNRGPVLFTSQYYRMNVLAGRMCQEQGALPILMSDWGSKWSLGWPVSMGVMPPFAGEARLSLLEPLAHEDRGSRRRLEVVLESFAEEVSRATDVFCHFGISFADIVACKVRQGIGPSILGLHRRAAVIRLLLQTLRPSLVFANGCRVDDMITGELCEAESIPAMMITHGSHPPPSNDGDGYELGEHGRRLINAPFGYTALQSPVAERFRKVFPTETVGLRTGPLNWATASDRGPSIALRDRMLGGEGSNRVIVHAGTPKWMRGIRFHVYETPDEYVQGICDLASAVEQVPDARLIVMFRPSPELSLDDLKALVAFSERVMVSVDEPLVDVLGFADLLVSFSSTVIEEALQNRVPVLLYGGDGRYQHIGAPSITTGEAPGPSPVYHVKECNDLPYALQYILDTCSGQALGDNLYVGYVYRSEQVVQLPELVRLMRDHVPA